MGIERVTAVDNRAALRQRKPVDALCLELHELLGRYRFSTIGSQAQSQLAWLLKEQGLSVEREVRVPGYRRTPTEGQQRGRIGRIDLLAARGTSRVGIEIDSWRTPKTKSVLKLLAFADLTHRFVLLNHAPGFWDSPVSPPTGVRHRRCDLDLVLHLDVVAQADHDVVNGNVSNWNNTPAKAH